MAEIWHRLSLTWVWFSTNSDAVQAICVILSAIAAFLVVHHAALISRREKTIDMISESLFDEDGEGPYTEFKNALKAIETSNIDIKTYAKPTIEQTKSYDIINRQLNYYELVSLGIRKGVFDETFYKFWFRSQLMRDFAKLNSYIEEIRRIHGEAHFSELRWLVARWERKGHPEENPPLHKLLWWLVCGKRQRVANAIQRQVERRAVRRAQALIAASKATSTTSGQE